MSYWKENLLDLENVQFEGSLHWCNFLVPLSWLCGTLIVCAFLFSQDISMMYIFMCGLLISGLTAIPAWLTSRFTEILVTNQRVMVKTGILRRHVVEINLEHLESFEVNQTLLGRIFDFGSIRAIGTGGTMVEMDYVDRPRLIRKIALESHLAIKNK